MRYLTAAVVKRLQILLQYSVCAPGTAVDYEHSSIGSTCGCFLHKGLEDVRLFSGKLCCIGRHLNVSVELLRICLLQSHQLLGLGFIAQEKMQRRRGGALSKASRNRRCVTQRTAAYTRSSHSTSAKKWQGAIFVGFRLCPVDRTEIL